MNDSTRKTMSRVAMLLTLSMSTLACQEYWFGEIGREICPDCHDGGGVETSGGGAQSTAGGAPSTAGGAVQSTLGGAPSAAGGALQSTLGGAVNATECQYPTTANPPPAGYPLCLASQVKGTACAPLDEGFICYRPCGPTNASGWKSLTCTNGAFFEVSTCIWTGTDYSAFRVPATLEAMDPRCGETTPQAALNCNVAPCVSCASPQGAFLDSAGNVKTGWCTCVPQAGGGGRWSCGQMSATALAWPCPGQAGCE